MACGPFPRFPTKLQQLEVYNGKHQVGAEVASDWVREPQRIPRRKKQRSFSHACRNLGFTRTPNCFPGKVNSLRCNYSFVNTETHSWKKGKRFSCRFVRDPWKYGQEKSQNNSVTLWWPDGWRKNATMAMVVSLWKTENCSNVWLCLALWSAVMPLELIDCFAWFLCNLTPECNTLRTVTPWVMTTPLCVTRFQASFGFYGTVKWSPKSSQSAHMRRNLQYMKIESARNYHCQTT